MGRLMLLFTFEFYCETFIVLYTGAHRPYRTCPACINIIIIIYCCSYRKSEQENVQNYKL